MAICRGLRLVFHSEPWIDCRSNSGDHASLANELKCLAKGSHGYVRRRPSVASRKASSDLAPEVQPAEGRLPREPHGFEGLVPGPVLPAVRDPALADRVDDRVGQLGLDPALL